MPILGLGIIGADFLLDSHVHAECTQQQLSYNGTDMSQYNSNISKVKAKPLLIKPKPRINGIVVDSNDIPVNLDDEVIWDPEWFKEQCGAHGTKIGRKRAWRLWKEFLISKFWLRYKNKNDLSDDITCKTLEVYAVYRFKTGTIS